MECLFVVLVHSLSRLEHTAQTALGGCIILVCSRAKEMKSLAEVPHHAQAPAIQCAERMECLCISLFRGPGEPVKGLLVILLRYLTVKIREAYLVLCRSISLFCSLEIPADRLLEIFHACSARLVEFAQVVLCGDIPFSAALRYQFTAC